MSAWGFVAAAYIGTALLVGGYAASLLRKKRTLERGRRGSSR